MADRFFCADLSASSTTLAGPEAHHAIHVMRIRPGRILQLFDGAGTSADACVHSLTRSTVTLEITSRHFTARPVTGRLTLAVAPPKGDRLKWMIEKLTEIGVDRFIALRCDRSVVDPRQSRLDKLAATVIGAAKQCRRDWLMELGGPADLSDVLQESVAGGDQVFLAHPTANDGTVDTSAAMNNCTILVGPEGGFTDAEVAAAEQQGARRLAWKGNILRTETAAIAFATLMMAKLQTG